MRIAVWALGAVLAFGLLAVADDGSVAWPGTVDGNGCCRAEDGAFPFVLEFTFDLDLPDLVLDVDIASWDCYGRCLLRYSYLCYSYCKWTGPFFWKCMAACEAYVAALCAAVCF